MLSGLFLRGHFRMLGQECLVGSFKFLTLKFQLTALEMKTVYHDEERQSREETRSDRSGSLIGSSRRGFFRVDLEAQHNEVVAGAEKGRNYGYEDEKSNQFEDGCHNNGCCRIELIGQLSRTHRDIIVPQSFDTSSTAELSGILMGWAVI